LAAELWDSVVNAEDGPKLSDTQKLDLQRRLDAYRDNPKAGSPWEEVKARLLGAK
jgi:putative addiction module component (TIGR02574 family)